MEAVMLVGGQGTRLRPLTLTTPKPMLPVANFPCTAHQIVRARDAGVTRIILSTSYKADVFENYFGNGDDFGIEIVYVTEDSPLGTGGAIRNVAQALRSAPDEPVLILNGDILSGHDIAKQVAQHGERGADVSLHLINVDDPRPFGLVPTDAEGRVIQFLEKPQTPEEIVTHQINAGCYVFRRAVIDAIPAGRVVSVERETFPGLLSSGAPVVGYIEDAYWLDLGNPLAFAQGSRDLVQGRCPSSLVETAGDALFAVTAKASKDSHILGGTALGERVSVGAGTTVDGSVVMAGATIGDNSTLINCVIGQNAAIGDHVLLTGVVVADGASIGDHNELIDGARVWPNTELESRSVRFSAE
ncbi:MAG: hypothetical protein RLZZ426_567 [Actinomycetota bacterium]